MKITADKEYLKQVVDKADRAWARAALDEAGGEDSSRARFDWATAVNYLTYLSVRALEDEEFCEDLEETLGELAEEGTPMKPQLVLLARLLQIGRWVKYDPDDNPGVEELEKDFEEFFDRVPTEKAREEKEELLRSIRSKGGEKRAANEMYG